MKKNLLLVFCKNPTKGQVKTRLAQSIGDEKALYIYQKLLEKTASILKDLNCAITIYYSESTVENDFFSNDKVVKKVQKGKDLGERMGNAFKEAFQTFNKVVIIGTDLWTVEAGDIEKAFNALNNNTAVIGPSLDGGFYLLGLTRYLPSLFKNKLWGTGEVLEKTVSGLSEEKVFFLVEKNDIDTIEDLQQHPDLALCIQ